ncbi:MAG: hypothetical protein GXY12_10050, partial [Clostridiaceae bacterium]|nr:hypothetical protein [Clostridiaceae bacterium]
MKNPFALLLCIVLCFYFIPLPLSAADTIQYKAIIETEPGPYVLENATSVSDAVYNSECIGVVVYCLYTEVDPPQVSDAFDSFEDKTVILSDVTFTGYIGCRELYLLGNAKMIVEDGKMEISGILANGGNIPALEDEDLVDYDSLENKLQGAERKYTITGNVDIDEPLHAYVLEIKKDATLKIIPSEPSPGERYNNDIIVSHSLKVYGNGDLTAEEGQELEIKGGCAVEGITLFDSEGIKEFNFTENNNEIFEYNADIEK